MGIKISEDKELVAQMHEAIKDNDGYCPCSLEKSEDTRCMCKEFREQTEPGECHCGLYIKYGQQLTGQMVIEGF